MKLLTTTIILLTLVANSFGQIDEDTAVIVELKGASIAIKGSRVRVQDIANVTTFVVKGGNERVTSLRANLATLGVFAVGKNRLSVKHDLIRKALVKSGFSAGNVQIEGPGQVRVRRKTIQIENRRILRMARRFVRNALVGIDENAKITFAKHISPVALPLAKYSSELHIETAKKNPTYIGQVNLKLVVELDGIDETLAVIPVLITRKVTTVRLARSIKKGAVITRGDIKLESQEVSTMGDQLFFRASDVIGMIAKRDLANGETITRPDIKQTPVVRKDDLLTVRVRSGLLTVRTICMAMQEGSPGEKILVQNLETKRQFAAIVIDEKTAEVKSSK